MATNLRLLCLTRTLNSPLPRHSFYRVVSHGLPQKHFSHRPATVSVVGSFSRHWNTNICLYIRKNDLYAPGYFERLLSSTPPEGLETVYRLHWIKHLRLISRVKILHVALVTALALPMTYWYSHGLVSATSLTVTVVAAAATTAGLFVLSYFFRRIVGQIDVNKSNETVIISTLTFWGNRRNNVFNLTDLVPLSDAGFEPKHMFHRLELYNSSYVYLCTLRYGEIYDRESLCKVIGLYWLDTSNRSQEMKIATKPEDEDCTNSKRTS